MIAPERFHLFEPSAQLRKWSTAEAIDTDAGVGGIVVRFLDEPVGAEHAQMAAHQRRAHTRGFGQLAGAVRALAQQLHDAAARGLRQCRQCIVERGHFATGTGEAKIQR